MSKDTLIINLRNRVNFNGYSYIAYLATQNKNDLVSELTVESPEAVYQAIYGYAVVNNSTQINYFINTSIDKNRAKKMAFQGLARGNHLAELYTKEDYKSYKTDIVFGLAQAGTQQIVTALVNKEPSLLEAAVQGYACGGHSLLLLDLVKGTQFYTHAIYHAAQAGHNELVDKLLTQCGMHQKAMNTTPNTKEEIRLFGFLNTAVAGYCKGYHLDLVAHLILKGADIQTALDKLKIGNKPCLDSYFGLLIVTPQNKFELIYEQIQKELHILNTSVSPKHIDNIKTLHNEYLSASNSNLLAFLSDNPVIKDTNILEQLDGYYIRKQNDEPPQTFSLPNS